MRSSYEPTSATAGHAATAAPRQAMAQAVGDVGRKRRRDAQAKEPPRQRGNRRLAARRVKHHHRTRVDQPVYRKRDHAGRPARLTVRPHEIVGMFVGRHRGYRRNAEHGKRGRPADDPIRAAHRAPPAASANSVVRAMSIMYVRCVSARAVEPQPRLMIASPAAHSTDPTESVPLRSRQPTARRVHNARFGSRWHSAFRSHRMQNQVPEPDVRLCEYMA